MTKKLAAPLFILVAAIALPACGPSSEAVCDHFKEVMAKELGEEISKGFEKEECVKEMDRNKEMEGSISWNKKAKCVMAADSLEKMEKCDADE